MILYKADQIKIVQIQTQVKSLREWGKKILSVTFKFQNALCLFCVTVQ